MAVIPRQPDLPAAGDANPPAPAVIRQLPPLMVNQIAAGEVIERPASVVKELVENALDAGATRIDVELEDGGVELIRVADNGRGINPDQLTLAVAPHATSKIADPEDLDRIATMGFRGEALASIASVARLEIRSRPRRAESAAVIKVEGADTEGPAPAPGPVGTAVTVRNLFFNTPARRKFLKTTRTEQSRCLDWVRDLAMAHPAVAFSVTADGKRTLDLPVHEGPRERAIALLGKELEPQLLEVSADRLDDTRGVLVWGLVGRPAIGRPHARAQHVFLGGRLIKDKTIQHALKEAFRGLMDPGRHPTAVLLIEMTPEAVDVNVHPAKLEVRFRDASSVHQAVYHAVKEALRRADLTPETPAERLGHTPVFGPRDAGGDAAAFAERVASMRTEAVGAAEAFDLRGARAPEPRLSFGVSAPAVRTEGFRSGPSAFVRISDAYIAVEDGDGILLIDQHALHERVMFEKLLGRLESAKAEGDGKLPSQSYLSPPTFELDGGGAERLAGLAAVLEPLGIVAEALGPRSGCVRSFPLLLIERKVDPAAFMTDLLERDARGELSGRGQGDQSAAESVLHEVLDMMACKAAVKAGDRLSDGEIAELLRLRETVERSSSCPHGRPTSVRVGVGQLEKLFDRR